MQQMVWLTGFHSKIYKWLMRLSIRKWIEDLNRHFPQEDCRRQEAHEKMLNITKYTREIKI